ncbi:MAG: hypothetical protein H0U76_22810 [Ktedonobacteraceae bacterium]|nr:hypothetical protein [Ktedonobacteraceae bacterium]
MGDDSPAASRSARNQLAPLGQLFGFGARWVMILRLKPVCAQSTGAFRDQMK